MPATTTLLDVVRLSTRHLATHASSTPRLDAELLAAHALGLRRLDLYLQYDRPLRDEELEPIRALLRRRAAGEPVAYILGEREFWGRSFRVTPAVLIPRPETELLVERALAWLRSRAGGGELGGGLRAADLGTGSGCLAVTLAAEAPGLEVVAGDVSAAAVGVARENAQRHGVGPRVSVVEGSWWAPLGGRPPVDLLVSNPPYVAFGELEGLARDVRDHEPRQALAGGDDGLEAYRALLAGAAAHLSERGAVILEIDPRRRDGVIDLLGAAWPRAQVAVHVDLAGQDRVVEAWLP